MNTGKVWSDEQVEQLKGLYKIGMSCSQIGARMGVSRNAVIGKAHRLDLPRRGQMVRTRPLRIRKADRQPSEPMLPKVERPHSPRGWKGSTSITKPKAQPVEAPPTPRGDRPTLMQLKANDCKWPLGDPRHADFHFCGDAQANDGPYCAGHAALARGQRQPEEAA